jgi:LCP family protein required for cell wall assembly
MVIYGSGPPQKPPRRGRRRRHRLPRWARWTLTVLGLLVLVVLAAGGYELWYLNNIYNKVTKLHGSDKKASTRLARQIPTSSQPITALMIGSDHRVDGATGKNGLSDTLMLARLDPKHRVISLLSIPRDLWVPSLGSKINSAYSNGGDDASLQAVEGVTGFKPNYLINVDFAGFQRLVDTLGGIYVNVDQYYYNPPELEQYTGFSAIDIKPGYQRLKGADALAFSRYRHTDDDFHRQARQQTFLRAFQARAADRFHGISVTDIPFINDLLGAISDSVTIVGPGGKRPSPQTLLSFAATAYKARAHVVTIPLSWTPYTAPDGEAALQVTNLPQALAQWRHPWRLENAAASIPGGHAKHKAAWRPAVDPSGVHVAVLNGNALRGAAGKAAHGLAAWGYRANPGNAPRQDYPDTWAYYRPGAAAVAGDLAHILGKGATASAMPASVEQAIGPRAQVAVVLGKGFGGTLAVTAPPKKTPRKSSGPPTTITPTTDYRTDFGHVQHILHFPIMYPTVSVAGYDLCPWVPKPAGAGVLSCQGASTSPIRVYGIGAAGKGWNSMYAVFKGPTAMGPYWGIEETRYTDAPLLQTPNATRTIAGRKYLFFFNGGHIQTIAFIQGGVAYWVQNSLLDDLTNPEMLAVARSLKPVG